MKCSLCNGNFLEKNLRQHLREEHFVKVVEILSKFHPDALINIYVDLQKTYGSCLRPSLKSFGSIHRHTYTDT